MNMRLTRWFFPFLVLLGLLGHEAWAAQSLVVGVIPVHPSRILAERYEPMRAFFERSLGQPVRIESAASFNRFQARTLAGDFDLTITPAHLARLVQKESGFEPLAQFSPDHDALIISRSDAPLTAPAQLKGQKLAVIDRLATTVMAALSYLDSQELVADTDYQVIEHRTHASVAQAVISGLSAAAVTTSQGLLQIPEDLRRKVVVFKHIADVPSFVMLGKPGATAQNEHLRRLLLAFPKETEGIDFLGHTGYSGITTVTERSMRRTDPYLKETRRLLQSKATP